MRKEANPGKDTELSSGLVEGRNAVTEALKAGRPLDKLFVAKGETDASLARIAAQAKAAGIPVVSIDRRKLDLMSTTGAHQGVIAAAAAKEYCSLEDILRVARDRGEDPFILVCDDITDPQNLGAMIRTAEAAGIHGVVIPKRHSAGVTATVEKTSAGATEYMAVARVPNIAAALDELKENGVWIYGTAAEGSSELWQTDLRGPIAIVIGSEGDGMSRLVSEKCDFRVSIPMYGKISSLNASCSAAVVIYEALRRRRTNSEVKKNG
ncbi:MAG: 23S rRNA (guanosine(2251)-2'-O)-methyltransferase RlmB [Oscillospiraceae bacterium]|nr:23S rRNA (guanosine(2251)-2'-O)-methyltransferase RlmB [Oscillospiraceae bacterium]